MTVDELNVLGPADVRGILEACCGSSKWIDEMIARRPFGSVGAVLEAADEVWRQTGPEDWLEAFNHHPRIGETRAANLQGDLAAGWSKGEQATAGKSDNLVQEQLADVNRRYEERFGYIYIVCATGRPAQELLAIAKDRMSNDRETELRVAAEEQRKITQLRLRKLFEVNQ